MVRILKFIREKYSLILGSIFILKSSILLFQLYHKLLWQKEIRYKRSRILLYQTYFMKCSGQKKINFFSSICLWLPFCISCVKKNNELGSYSPCTSYTYKTHIFKVLSHWICEMGGPWNDLENMIVRILSHCV